jgi:hypothetical protein
MGYYRNSSLMMQLTARGEGGRCRFYGHKELKRQARKGKKEETGSGRRQKQRLIQQYNVRRIEDKREGSDHVTSKAFSRCFSEESTNI